MKTYDVSRLPSSIVLGWDGENNWRPVAFDCSALLAGHPDGVITLWLLPKGETQAFPVALSMDGDTVVWTPLNEEMTAERGQLQIVVQDGTDVGKSRVIDYSVHDSLVGGAEHPAETPSWAVQVVEDVTETAGHYPRIVNGNWYVWDVSEQEWVDTGVAAGGGGTGTVKSVNNVQPDTNGNVALNIPSKTSDLQNDSGFLTQHQSLSAYRTASAQDTIDAAQDTAIAAKYSKPSTGIPKSDLASGVQASLDKADTALQQHQSLSGYATETYVQQQIAAIPDELPAVTAADNGKFLRVVSGAWAAATVPSAEGASF